MPHLDLNGPVTVHFQRGQTLGDGPGAKGLRVLGGNEGLQTQVVLDHGCRSLFKVLQRNAGVAVRIVVVAAQDHITVTAGSQHMTHMILSVAAVHADLDPLFVLGEEGFFHIVQAQIQTQDIHLQLGEERQIQRTVEEAGVDAHAFKHHGVHIGFDLKTQLLGLGQQGLVAVDGLLAVTCAQQSDEQQVKAQLCSLFHVSNVLLKGAALRVQGDAQSSLLHFSFSLNVYSV